jgi:adenine-specific DNA-methyltransferase
VFLKAHPSLVLDTKHFDQDFVDRLLGGFENLDDMTGGLLVHSENFQALNLLFEKYRERIKIIYIDPPYNTGKDDFLYKDQYQHSTWLSMMEDRIRQSFSFLREDGAIFVSCDDGENANLRSLLNSIYGREHFIAAIVWQKRYSRDNRPVFGTVHDYIQAYARKLDNFAAVRNRLPPEEESLQVYRNPNNDPRGRWRPIPMTAQGYRPNQMYPIVTPNGFTHRPPAGAVGQCLNQNTRNCLQRGGHGCL